MVFNLAEMVVCVHERMGTGHGQIYIYIAFLRVCISSFFSFLQIKKSCKLVLFTAQEIQSSKSSTLKTFTSCLSQITYS